MARFERDDETATVADEGRGAATGYTWALAECSVCGLLWIPVYAIGAVWVGCPRCRLGWGLTYSGKTRHGTPVIRDPYRR